MTRKRCGVVVVAALVAVMVGGNVVSAQDLSSWIRPDGFVSPDLNAGQYAFRAGIGVNGGTGRYSTRDQDSDYYYRSRRTTDQWRLDSRFTYALTDQWVVLSSVSFRPRQKAEDYYTERHMTILGDPSDEFARDRYELDHQLNTSVTVAFKPARLFELFVSGYYRRDMESASRTGTDLQHTDAFNESYELFVGFNMAR